APRRRSSSRTAASTRCTTRSRCCATPATRCSCPRRTGRRTPSALHWVAACRSYCRPPNRRASASASNSSRRRGHPVPRRCCSSRRAIRRAQRIRPRKWRRAGAGRRGRTMYELLAKIQGVSVLPPEGAFYCFPSFEGVLGRDIAGRTPRTSLELSEVLLDAAKVAVVPGEAFGAPGYARLSFALGDG